MATSHTQRHICKISKRLALAEREWTNSDGSVSHRFVARVYENRKQGYKYLPLSELATDVETATKECIELYKSLGVNESQEVDDVDLDKLEIEIPTPEKNYRVYFIHEQGSPYVKIGKAVNPEDRLNTLQIGNPKELKLLFSVKPESGIGITKHDEIWFHRRYKNNWVRGEWYCFSPQEIKKLCKIYALLCYENNVQCS